MNKVTPQRAPACGDRKKLTCILSVVASRQGFRPASSDEEPDCYRLFLVSTSLDGSSLFDPLHANLQNVDEKSKMGRGLPFVKMFCHSLPYVLPPATKDGRRACRAKQGAEYHLIFSTLPPLMQNQITHPVEAIDGFSLSRQNLWHDTARHFDNPHNVPRLQAKSVHFVGYLPIALPHPTW